MPLWEPAVGTKTSFLPLCPLKACPLKACREASRATLPAILSELHYAIFRGASWLARKTAPSSPGGLSLEQEISGLQEQASAAEEILLRQLLRRSPTWARGHLLLAKQAIRSGKPLLAYASVQAVFQLSEKEHWKKEAKFLLGKCFLATARPHEAEQIFEELAKTNSSPAIQEERAAAAFQLGKREKAREFLETIPESQRSREARLMLDYLRL